MQETSTVKYEPVPRNGPQGSADVTIVYEKGPPRIYTVNGVEVPSVTEVLNVLFVPLSWWGQGIGIEGMLWLYEFYGEGVFSRSKREIEKLLTMHKLDVNKVRDKAGERGTAVHQALEAWVDDGLLPDPSLYPAAQRGYVEGLRRFLSDVDPTPLGSEVLVGHPEEGYAGRYDLRMEVTKDVEAVTKKRIREYKGTVHAGHYLVDLKTSSGVFKSHKRQVAGYELASVRCGFDPTDERAILRTTQDGGYEFVVSDYGPEAFLNALAVWRDENGKKKESS